MKLVNSKSWKLVRMHNTKTKIIAALSGGVDSSVAASIYIDKGYDVIGVTLKMKSCDDTKEKTKSCCGLDDNIQVGLVAEKLGIPHYFLDVRKDFKEKILRYACNEYHKGRTPNPCVLCNYFLKFGMLLDFAKDIGAIGIITGHYAILLRDDKGDNVKLFKGLDDNKNQTYFLSALTQKQLNHSYMPLGELTKTEVREIAAKLELPNAEKKESQDACFGYKGETFAETLSRTFNSSCIPGDIVTEGGTIVGKHNGIHNFTIGQRKGLGVALGKPAYVVKIDSKSNTVVISTDSSLLLADRFTVTNMNWLDFSYDRLECEVQTRYRQTPIKAVVTKTSEFQADVELLAKSRAVTPGQALAVYKGKQLIAGGWIDRILNNKTQNKNIK
jgi:tRNA-uridine 2-sulfurtransferase